MGFPWFPFTAQQHSHQADGSLLIAPQWWLLQGLFLPHIQQLDLMLKSRLKSIPLTEILVFIVLQGSNVMEDQDLKEIGITDASHRKKILHAARSLPKVELKNLVSLLFILYVDDVPKTWEALMIDQVFSCRWKHWAVMAAPHFRPGWRIWACTSICTTSWPVATALWSVSKTCGNWRLSMWATVTDGDRKVYPRVKLVL